MKTKILSGLICCLGIFSANAQTITAPTGQNLTITNPIDVTGTGNSMNVPSDGVYKIGGSSALGTKGSNILLGRATGNALTTGDFNLFQGVGTGFQTTTGSHNTFSGFHAGINNQSGNGNLCFGTNAGRENISGNCNILLGNNAGFNTISGYNTFLGVSSGYANTTGTGNIAFGFNSGGVNTTGSYNLFLGYEADATSGNLTNAIAIGANSRVSISNTVVLGNGATTITGQGLGSGSGLRFANITSATAAGTGGANKVLSVDAAGNVILVGLTGAGVGTTSVGGLVAEKVDALSKQVEEMKSVKTTWIEKDGDGFLRNVSPNGVVIEGKGFEGQALVVKGKMLSEEVNVQLQGSDWPDYVFKPNYKRMTLGEVEKFISINGHLPNIPSATEMAATGNNLGKTDVKLLEKVEELTLYLLDMKKANDAQAAELKVLKKQVSKLRKK